MIYEIILIPMAGAVFWKGVDVQNKYKEKFNMKIDHPLWQTLRSLKGNQRACVVAEPLWAIPVYLYIPFASMYMAASGLLDLHIGVVTSVGLAVQFLASLFSGAIVDKYGRCKSMLIFGLLSWAFALFALGGRTDWYFIVNGPSMVYGGYPATVTAV